MYREESSAHQPNASTTTRVVRFLYEYISGKYLVVFQLRMILKKENHQILRCLLQDALIVFSTHVYTKSRGIRNSIWGNGRSRCLWYQPMGVHRLSCDSQDWSRWNPLTLSADIPRHDTGNDEPIRAKTKWNLIAANRKEMTSEVYRRYVVDIWEWWHSPIADWMRCIYADLQGLILARTCRIS